MRKFILLLPLLSFTAILFAQKDPPILDFNGIDRFRLWMDKAAVEKLIGKKISFKHIGVDEVYTETIDVTYKGISFELMMMRSEEVGARLESITTKSPLYKTAEGIGIGSDLQTIIDTYEKHLLMITRDMVTLADIDDIRSSIVFYLKNNKVEMISVAPTAAFRDRE